MSDKTKKNFLNGAMILSAALVLVKVIGFIYKIPLFNLIGGDGYGYEKGEYTAVTITYDDATGTISETTEGTDEFRRNTVYRVIKFR